MPPLEMRGRYIQREWFSDTDLQTKVSADVREFYFGLAMLCDDKGWMPRDLVGIGAAIYRFQTLDERDRLVRVHLDALQALGKVRSHRCKCLFLPTVARKPRAGQRTYAHFEQHQTHLAVGSKGIERDQKELNPIPNPSLPDPSPARTRGGKPTAAGATITEFQRRVPRNEAVGG